MKCFNCGVELDEDSKFWIECDIDVRRVDYRIKRYKKAYLYFAIIVLILGVIGGIVLGSIYKLRTGYLFTKEEFNVGLMLYCWLATLLFDLFIFAIYSVCHRLDLLIDKR